MVVGDFSQRKANTVRAQENMAMLIPILWEVISVHAIPYSPARGGKPVRRTDGIGLGLPGSPCVRACVRTGMDTLHSQGRHPADGLNDLND